MNVHECVEHARSLCVVMSGQGNAEELKEALHSVAFGDNEDEDDVDDLVSRWAATSAALASVIVERDAALRALAELRNDVTETVTSAQALTLARLGEERRLAAAVKAKYKRRIADLEARCVAAEKRVAETESRCGVRAEEAAAALDRVAALQSALNAAEAASRSAVACAEAECAAKSEGVQRVLRDKCAHQLRELTTEVEAWRAFVTRMAGGAPRTAKEHAELHVVREALRASEERALQEVALANASADAARARASDAEQDAAFMREAVAAVMRRCGVNPSDVLSGQFTAATLTQALTAALNANARPLEARLAQADADAVALRAAVESARAGQARSDARSAALAEQLQAALDTLRTDMAELEAARQQEADQAQAAFQRVAIERDMAVQQVASLRRAMAEMAAGNSMGATTSPALPPQSTSAGLLERAHTLLVA